jgi:hypothetical protein
VEWDEAPCLPTKRLYDAAGYEPAAQYATMRQLRKRLVSPALGT